MRLVLETCAGLSPPLLTTMSRETKRLTSVFHDYDLNHDGSIDVNEWMLMLPYLHRHFLAALQQDESAPHRNRALRALRVGKKRIADHRQQQLFDAADRGETLPEGPLDPELMLSGLEKVLAADGGAANAEQRRAKTSMAPALIAQADRRRQEKEEGRRRGGRRRKGAKEK